MDNLTPFHLAIPVNDLVESRQFYGDLLGCSEGRSSDVWVDFDFFGHQLVCHVTDCGKKQVNHNPVDGHAVPVPHFGVVLEMEQWYQLKDRLLKANIKFVIDPHIRFEGLPGEQATMFFYDPSCNALEFKAFADIKKQLFE